MRTAIPAAILAALIACVPASAETLVVSAPEKVGMSKARLDQIAGFAYGGRGDTPVHKLWPASSGTSGMTLTPQDFVATLAKAPLLYSPAPCGTTACRSMHSV
jgi:hypothetical protein